MTLGAYLRTVRLSAGRTIKEVADVLGVSEPYLSDLERDKRNVPPARLLDYAAAYQCAASEIESRYVCPHCGKGAERQEGR